MSGRPASTKIEAGDLALSVGIPARVAPLGWSWVELNALAEMATGHTPSRSHPEYWGGNIKWMCASDARFQHGGVVFETAETINQQGIENSAAVILPADTVCLARTGASIGYAVRLGEPMATNQGFVNWICGPNLCPKFLQYVLVAEIAFLKRIAYGAAHHTIYFPEVKAFHVCIPPLSEQKRIVGILNEAFDGIATAKANAQMNLQNARALFESHLQAVFTQRGEGWGRTVPLSTVLSAQPRNGWSPPMEYQTGTGVPVLTLSSVTGFEYDGSRVKLSSAPTREDAHYWLQEGELLVTRSNTQQLVGHVAVYDGTPRKAICCDLIMKMQVDAKKADTRFIYFYLRSPEARSYLTSRAQGASSTMKKIGKQVVQNIPIPMPSLALQKAATEKLDSIRDETQRLESLYQRKLAALDEMKKSLLHLAFSGQL